MAIEYDVVILGGGPGGYVAAIRAAQLGYRTAIVENQKIGGTCLHKGCIPSKALLRSAELFATLVEGEKYGITATDVSLDYLKIQERKNKIVEQLYQGVLYLMKKGNIDIYEGYGRILGPSIFSPTGGTISVEMNSGEENEMLVPKYLIIATGSTTSSLAGLPIDGKSILGSEQALELDTLPSSILIIGGGILGIEWASMMSDFGVEVTIIEQADRLLPQEDVDISKEIQRLLKKRKVKIYTSATILPETFKEQENGVTIEVESKGKQQPIQVDKVLVAVGRKANVKNIGIENTAIQIENDHIKVNSFGQTSEEHIYAIGDVTGGLQLAHVASREGIVAIEHLAGLQPLPINYDQVPRCIYGRPEIARVGITEQEARDQDYKIKTAKISLKAIGKAVLLGESDGFVKMIMDEESNDLLGVHMIGAHVTELISEAGLALVLDATPWEIAHTIHPHPSISEALMESSLALEEKNIHG